MIQDGDNDQPVGLSSFRNQLLSKYMVKNSPAFTKSTSNPFADISGNAPIPGGLTENSDSRYLKTDLLVKANGSLLPIGKTMTAHLLKMPAKIPSLKSRTPPL